MVPCASKVEKANGLIGSPHSDAGASPKVPMMNQLVRLHAWLSRDRFSSVSLLNFASQWEAPPVLPLRECCSHWPMNNAVSVATKLLQRVLKNTSDVTQSLSELKRNVYRCKVYASAPVPIKKKLLVMSGSVWTIWDLQMWIHLYKEKRLLQPQQKNGRQQFLQHRR